MGNYRRRPRRGNHGHIIQSLSYQVKTIRLFLIDNRKPVKGLKQKRKIFRFHFEIIALVGI